VVEGAAALRKGNHFEARQCFRTLPQVIVGAAERDHHEVRLKVRPSGSQGNA
jgi:hypothetical protein